MGRLTTAVSGDVVTFKSAAVAPIRSLNVHFEPMQEGTGDPSPTNVRPIVATNSIDVRRVGKNLYYDGDKTFTSLLGMTLSKSILPGTYTFSAVVTSSDTDESLCTIRFMKADQTTEIANATISRSVGNERVSVQISLSETSPFIYLYPSTAYPKGEGDTASFTDIQIEYGIQPTTYEPPNNTAIPVSWTETVYGGSVDLISGVLTSKYAVRTFIGDSSEEWEKDTATSLQRYRIALPDLETTIVDARSPVVCNIGVSATHGEAYPYNAFTYYTHYGTKWFYFYSSTQETTLESFLSWLANNPIQIAYTTTPQIFQLPEYQLKTIKGYNKIWTNLDAFIDIEYDFAESFEMTQVRKRINKAMSEFALPPEYQKVDWLQGNGANTKINTGVPGDDETLRINFRFMPIELAGSYYGLFGNYKTENDNYCWRCILMANTASQYDRGFYVTCGNNSPGGGGTTSCLIVPSGSTMIGVRCSLDMEYGKCTMSGLSTSSATRPYAEKATNANNIAIGALSTTTTGGSAKFRFYDFKIWSHGKLIRNYVPCYRKSDNKPGFYDTVNHTFNPSIGTADFTAGNDN